MRQRASACVSVRQRASACVGVRRRASACVGVRRRASACVGVRRRASACVGVRRRASACAILRLRPYRVEEVADPLGDGEHHHYGQPEGDVPGALDEDHGQTDGHSHDASQLARRPDQRVLPDVIGLRQHTGSRVLPLTSDNNTRGYFVMVLVCNNTRGGGYFH